jgi:hypothetical protein
MRVEAERKGIATGSVPSLSLAPQMRTSFVKLSIPRDLFAGDGVSVDAAHVKSTISLDKTAGSRYSMGR